MKIPSHSRPAPMPGTFHTVSAPGNEEKRRKLVVEGVAVLVAAAAISLATTAFRPTVLT